MGLKLTPPPRSTDNDRRRFDTLVYDALKVLDSRAASSGNSTTTTAAIAALTARVASLESASSTGSAAQYSSLTAAEDITQYNVVTAGGERADNATAAHAGEIAGIAIQDAATSGSFQVAPNGVIIANNAWTWTPGDIMWAGADGALATTPGTGAFQQIVGLAISATEILVAIGDATLLVADSPFIGLASGLFAQTKAGFSDFMLSLRSAVDAAAARLALGLDTAATYAATAFATSSQGAKADSAVQSVVAGANVTVDSTDPQNPVVSAAGGGGGTPPLTRAYLSTNTSAGSTGAWRKVALDTVDIDDSGLWDAANSRAVIQTSGLYFLSYLPRTTTNLGNAPGIFVNGALGVAGGYSSTSRASQACSFIKLSAGDYIEPYTFVSTGATLESGVYYSLTICGPF